MTFNIHGLQEQKIKIKKPVHGLVRGHNKKCHIWSLTPKIVFVAIYNVCNQYKYNVNI